MRKTLSFIFLFIALITQATTVKVSSVYTEQMSNPLGLDTTTPRFSWQMQSDGQGVMQTAYRILVASSVEMKIKLTFGIRAALRVNNRCGFLIME